MTITLFLSLLSKRVPTSTSFLPCVVTPDSFRHNLFLSNSVVIFCHSQILICLIYLSLPNLCYCTIRSMMFLKVLDNVFESPGLSECLYNPKLFLIIYLLPFTKLLELLDIDHGWSEVSIIFVPLLLKFSHVLVVL